MNRCMKHCLNATVAVTLIGAIAGCVTQPRTPEQTRTDEEVARDVKSTLSADSHIYTEHIKVHVANGVAQLSGYVWNDYDMYQAQQDAESVPGVTRVVNDMELELEGQGNSPVTR